MPEDINKLTESVIGLAIEVHKNLGPGLLESAYRDCLAHEFKLNGILFEKERPLPVHYKGMDLDCGYRIDMIIEKRLVLELKTVEFILPVHKAQLLTYLKLSGIKTGLLINFNTALVKDGIVRMVW
jgi:GxxExxY protein